MRAHEVQRLDVAISEIAKAIAACRDPRRRAELLMVLDRLQLKRSAA